MNLLAWITGAWKAGAWRAGAWKGTNTNFVRSPFRTFIVQAESRHIAIGPEKRDQKPVA